MLCQTFVVEKECASIFSVAAVDKTGSKSAKKRGKTGRCLG